MSRQPSTPFRPAQCRRCLRYDKRNHRCEAFADQIGDSLVTAEFGGSSDDDCARFDSKSAVLIIPGFARYPVLAHLRLWQIALLVAVIALAGPGLFYMSDPYRATEFFEQKFSVQEIFDRVGSSDSSRTAGTLSGWPFKAGGEIATSPVVDNGVVFVRSRDRNLYALDARTGRQKWSINTKDKVKSSPAVAAELVYVTSLDKVLALDVETGKEVWSEYTNIEGAESSPTVAEGTLYFGGWQEEFCVVALDAKTGEQKWRYETKDSVDEALAVDGTVYFGSWDNKVYAVSAKTGKLKWQFETGDQIVDTLPALAQGRVFIRSWDHYLYALDSSTGKKLWRFKIGEWADSSPVVAGGILYIGGIDGYLYALDAESGSQKWRFYTLGTIATSPSVVDGKVYFGSVDGHLYAVDMKTGKEVWRFKAGKEVLSSPAVAEGIIYVGGDNGNLYALDAKTGEPLKK